MFFHGVNSFAQTNPPKNSELALVRKYDILNFSEKLSTGTSLGETVKASVIDQHDDSRVYMHEQSWTAPTVAVSTASSRTESETSTKSALKESRATSETNSFVDDMKSDAGEVSRVKLLF